MEVNCPLLQNKNKKNYFKMNKFILVFFLLSTFNVFAESTLPFPKCTETVPTKFNDCSAEITLKNGHQYIGEFKKGAPNGKGTLILTTGGKYVGDFKDQNFNGNGTFTWPNGDKYIGEYKDNKQNGNGTFIWAGGEKYVGYFKDNKKHGLGKYTYANKEEYVGEWKEDTKSGQGTLTCLMARSMSDNLKMINPMEREL